MKFRNYMLAILFLAITSNACAMRPVTISYNQPISVTPIAPYYYQAPATTYVLPSYYPTYDYSYWPTWGSYDYGYWDYYYPDTPASAFVKACAVTGVLAVAFALIGAIMSSH